MAKIMQVEEPPMSNKHLPVPLIVGERVIIIEDNEDEQFIKIRHNKGQTISRFNRGYFGAVRVK